MSVRAIPRKIAIGLVSLSLALAALALVSTALPLDATSSNTVVANVIVSNICFTSASPSSPSFASVAPPGSDNTNVEITDNDVGGNSQANVYVAGTSGSGATLGDWIGSGANTIPVGNTLWDLTSDSAYIGNALTNSLVETSIVVPAPNTLVTTTSANIFLGLSVPAGTSAGAYTQNIEIENLCGASETNTVITANVIVQGVCYISLSTTTLNFGTLTPTATYDTNAVVTDSDTGGNIAANVILQATSGSNGDWIGSGTNTIPVGNTLWDTASQSSYTGTPLTDSGTLTPIVVPAPNTVVTTTSANVFFGLGVPAGTAGGTYTQNILIENSC